MKHISQIVFSALALALILSGCGPRVTPTDDGEFRAAWREAMDEVREDLRDDPEAGGAWSAWAEAWEDWGGEADDRFEDMDRKKHVWKVLDGAGEELAAVTDEEAVERLDDLLGVHGGEDWKRPEETPEDPLCTYVYRQEKTLLAGQDPDAEREYEDLLSFSVSASEDAVTLRILGGLEELSLVPGVSMEDILTFSISVPAETAAALRDPAQFTEGK